MYTTHYHHEVHDKLKSFLFKHKITAELKEVIAVNYEAAAHKLENIVSDPEYWFKFIPIEEQHEEFSDIVNH